MKFKNGGNTTFYHDQAKKTLGEHLYNHIASLNKEQLEKLDTIIQPWYLGCDEWQEGVVKPKTILFNHRADGYTGADWFFEEMDKLWEQRQDFKVYTTLAQIDRPWNERVKLTGRNEYMDFLSKMKLYADERTISWNKRKHCLYGLSNIDKCIVRSCTRRIQDMDVLGH